MLDLFGVSRASFDLIVASEVTSEAVYERRFRHLEWPGEQSGPTGGSSIRRLAVRPVVEA